MNRAHDLAATRGNAIPYQETIEIDAFIAQRIAFVHRDHNRRKSAHMFGLGERGPRKWVSRFICFNAVTHGVAIVVHAKENSRSEERRVRKECVITGSSRWSPYH